MIRVINGVPGRRFDLVINGEYSKTVSFIITNVASHQVYRFIDCDISFIKYTLELFYVAYTPFDLAVHEDKPKKDSRIPYDFSSIIKDDMLLILSLMRQNGVNKILAMIAKKPGLSIKQLSNTLKMRKETTCDHVRELLAKGVIVKDNKVKTPGYMINDEKNQRIIRAIDFTLDEK